MGWGLSVQSETPRYGSRVLACDTPPGDQSPVKPTGSAPMSLAAGASIGCRHHAPPFAAALLPEYGMTSYVGAANDSKTDDNIRDHRCDRIRVVFVWNRPTDLLQRCAAAGGEASPPSRSGSARTVHRRLLRFGERHSGHRQRVGSQVLRNEPLRLRGRAAWIRARHG